MLELSLLGGFEVRSGPGEPISLGTRKARALLAYLALHPDEAVPRQSLTGVFWSDRAEPQANNSLSQALSAIRKALDGVTPSPLVVEADSLQIVTSAVEIDVLAFEKLSGSEDLAELDRAESLYRGELLARIGVRDPAFEEWLETKRRRLHALAVGALTKLLDIRRYQRQWQELATSAERLLKLDPLQEAAHRALMHGYAEQGQIGLALAQYETLAETLKRELGVEPEGETKRLRETIVRERSTSSAAPIANLSASADKQTSRRPLVAGVLALLVVGAGIALWQRPWELREEPASVEAMAFPLPDKPSIAVLPFNNMSEDQSQEYFADGMTEDLITDLSKISELFVIARNSSFSYKGQQVRVGQVAEELGVRYVLQGSVRRAGDEVRINAQLIDATTGGHLWAERYDGSVSDVFALQDKVTQQIVTALAVSLTASEQVERQQTDTESAAAYDAFLKGWELFRRGTAEDYAAAVPFLEKAVKLDPDFSRAHAALAAVYWNSFNNRWFRSFGLTDVQATERSRRELRKAMKNPTALAHRVASERAAFYSLKADKAISHAEQAIALDGNDPAGYLAMANALVKANRPEEALEFVHQAMRLDPRYPVSYSLLQGRAEFANQDYQAAATTFEKAADRDPNNDWTFVYLGAVYGHLGQEQDAETAVKKANSLRAHAGWSALTLFNVKPTGFESLRGELPELGLMRAGLEKAGVKPGTEWIGLVRTNVSGEFEVKGATTINVETAKALHERGATFVDVSETFMIEHIPNAHSLPYYNVYEGPLVEFVDKDKDEEIVIYGLAVGDMDRNIPLSAAKAVAWGFKNVYYFPDGMDGWKRAGYPVE